MIYSKKKKKKSPGPFVSSLSPEIASSFGEKHSLVFKKSISHSSEVSQTASHLLDSLFPSDTPHCLGLRLRVLAEERF